MKVVIHAGAHFTDEDRLINCLVRNRAILSEAGSYAPEPRRYRRVLRDVLQQAVEHGVSQADAHRVFDALDEEPGANRMILSNASLFGTPKMAVGRGLFYPGAEHRLTALHSVFAESELELFLALRNPATFLPALFAKAPTPTMAAFLNHYEPEEFRWSETIARLRAIFPDMPITLWCNEDSPLIWGEIVRELGALDPIAPIYGEYDLLSEIMTERGMTRFERYMAGHPELTEAQKRRVVLAFLNKFVKVDEVEQELDLPGWDETRIATLSEAYDEDIEAVSKLPSVRLIAP